MNVDTWFLLSVQMHLEMRKSNEIKMGQDSKLTTDHLFLCFWDIPILPYPILSYSILSYPILSYPILSYPTLRYTYTTLHYTTLHYTTLHYTTLHYTTLHYTTLHYTTLHYTTLHYTTLHYTTLHYTTLHYTDNKKITINLQCEHVLCHAYLYGSSFQNFSIMVMTCSSGRGESSFR